MFSDALLPGVSFVVLHGLALGLLWHNHIHPRPSSLSRQITIYMNCRAMWSVDRWVDRVALGRALVCFKGDFFALLCLRFYAFFILLINDAL